MTIIVNVLIVLAGFLVWCRNHSIEEAELLEIEKEIEEAKKQDEQPSDKG